MIKGKRVLVAGGGGSIGSELVKQLSLKNKVFILDINETLAFDLAEELQQKKRWVNYRIGDVRNLWSVQDVFSDFKPQIIINAAALKHVSPSQKYPREYVETNILGHLNLIEEAKRWETTEKVIYISTDKAVAEKKNVMGATKMCSETIHTTMGKGFIAVRFGNVLGSRGSLLEIWARQFKNKEPLTITDLRMTRYMMSIPQACSLVIEAIKKGKGDEVFIFNMGPPKKVIELKEELYGHAYPIKLIGLRPGESLNERLMTEDEEKRAIKKGKFWILK